MFPRLPPTITSLIFALLLATPILSIAQPLPDEASTSTTTTIELAPLPRAPTPAGPVKRQPTRRMGARKAKKAEPLKKKDYSSFLCPGGSVACPVYTGEEITPESAEMLDRSLSSLADWFKVGFECMELDSELNSCGGCLALGAGQDCSSISNARATGCEQGKCAVYSCFDGYVVSPDRQSCVKKGSATPATPITAVTLDLDQVILV